MISFSTTTCQYKMCQIKEIVSEKGKRMLLHESYIYTLERTTTRKLIFRCRNPDCKGKIMLLINILIVRKNFINLARYHTNLSMDTFLSQPTSHCHALNPDLVPSIQLKNDIKARVATTGEPTSSIFRTTLRMHPLSAADQLPKNDALMFTIRRQRTAPKMGPVGRILEGLRKTDRGENFILFEDEALITFTTKSNLSILKQHKHWFADETFKVKLSIKCSLSSLIVSRSGVQMIFISYLHYML